MAYEFEVFISYRHQAPVYEWVHNHFYPLFRDWLGAARPGPTRVFIDDAIDVGADWPLELEHALRNSCFLVAVCSPDYFQSRWCLAEWQSMRERETILSLRTAAHPRGLIFPVKFNDGRYFPEEAQRIQHLDLSPWNIPAPYFAQTQGYIELTEKVRDFAEDVAQELDRCPQWQDDWPVSRPEPEEPAQMLLPRLQ